MSNHYPEWWDTTLTVFNKYTDPQTRVITWYKTVLEGCFWKYIGNKVVIDRVTLETNNTICRIPKNENFLEKYLWIEKPNDLKSNYFTLGRGDIIVKNAVDDEIDEYRQGSRSTDLITKYKELQGCTEIEEIAVNVGGGRNEEHYFVRGI